MSLKMKQKRNLRVEWLRVATAWIMDWQRICSVHELIVWRWSWHAENRRGNLVLHQSCNLLGPCQEAAMKNVIFKLNCVKINASLTRSICNIKLRI